MICKNPNCQKEFEEKNRTKPGEYYSGTCQAFHRALKKGEYLEEDLDQIQAGTIHLPNGIDIRNDAMDKEISGYLNTTYQGRKK